MKYTTIRGMRARLVLSFVVLCSLVQFAENVSAADINYRLKWLINSSVVGDIYADEYGYFAKEGLQVTVKAGGPERDAIRELELGYAQFGVASADQVIRAVAKGASVVVIAQLFQVNPLQWIYRADEVELQSLGDLKGKKVGITYGGNDETIMRALMAKAKITEEKVALSSVRYDYTPFFLRKVQVWPVYRNTQGIFLGNKLAAAGEKVGFFNPSDFGVRFVANSIVTTEKMVRENPQLVNKFITALLAAWEAALAPANRAKSIQAVAKHDRDSSNDLISQQLDSTRQLVKPTSDFSIGTINQQAWIQTEEIMLEQKLISRPVGILKRLR